MNKKQKKKNAKTLPESQTTEENIIVDGETVKDADMNQKQDQDNDPAEQTQNDDAKATIEEKKSVTPDNMTITEKSDLSPPNTKQKKSPMTFLWPVVTAATFAGGVIGTQGIWLKDKGNTQGDASDSVQILRQSVDDSHIQVEKLSADMDLLKQQINDYAKASENMDTQYAAKQDLEEQATNLQALNTMLQEQETTLQTLTEQSQMLQDDWKKLNSEYGRINAQLEGTISQIQALSQNLDENTSPEIEAQLAALETSRRQSVQALQGQIANLTQTLSDVKSQQPAFEIFDKRVNQLESNVDDLQNQMQQIDGKIKEDLDTLTSSVEQSKNMSSLFAEFDQLNQSVLSGQDYSAALQNFLAADESYKSLDAVVTLMQHQQGIETMWRLKSTFNALSRDLVVTSRQAAADASDSKAKALFANFNDLVTVTRNDGGEEGSIDRLIYDVKLALEGEELAQVVQLFEKAQKEVQQEAGDWLADVQKRDETISALQELKSQLLKLS